jgi:hypothetical protein
VRKVFSSPRLENVERVAQLLGDAGIQTRITHGRSYKGGLRGDFSYIDHTRTEPVPAVWVVKSEDQPTARAILRESGLLDSTRMETGYTLPVFRSEEPAAADDPGRKRAFRLKVGLLLAIAVVIALAFVSLRKPQPAAPVAAPPLAAGVSPTPDALAVAVLAGELPTREGQVVCLSIDGHDPAPPLLAMLPATPGAVWPASQCASRPELVRLAIGSYRVAASGAGTGAGTVVLERKRGPTAPPVLHTYDVYRNASGWRVIEPYQP